jgi:protein O-mannosyl-transferase
LKADNKKKNAVLVFSLCLVLAIMTLSVYLQVGSHQFISFDDYQYVRDNPHVSGGITGKNVLWAFTSIEASNWHPVTWISHMADVQLYRMNPRYHHLTNVVIHTASSLLLLLLLLRCTGSLWKSSFVAALFALHPLHVESVAWVAERKDVLSAFFGILTLFFYSGYLARKTPGRYLLALFSFLLGLMSKPMLVTLPVIMLLMDYWPLGRYRQENQGQSARQLMGRMLSLIKEKTPFFALTLPSVVLTIYAQHQGGSVAGLKEIPLLLRTGNALIAYVKYIGKILWPSDLAIFYPLPTAVPLWQVIGSLLILVLLSTGAIRAGRRYPYLVLGWFWFLITLLPVIGLIQVGGQSMADRYTYLPALGLFIMAAWGVPDLVRRLRHREGILALLAGMVIIASTALTWKQIGYWQDGISLYRHALQVTSNNHLANFNLAVDLTEKGDLDGAIQAYRASLEGNTFISEAHNNLGFVLAKKGDWDAAIKEYQASLWMNPKDTRCLLNLGDAFSQQGDLKSAIKQYRQVLALTPENTDASTNLGNALTRSGDLDAAIEIYRGVLRIIPASTDVHNNLGAALARKGDLDGAISEYQAALRINPVNTDAHINMGITLMEKGSLDAAIQEFQQVLRINPNDTVAPGALARALARKKINSETGK